MEADRSTRRDVLALHRQRLAERGLQRIEVNVPALDAEVIRRIARDLRQDGDAARRWREVAASQAAPARPTKKFADWILEPD